VETELVSETSYALVFGTLDDKIQKHSNSGWKNTTRPRNEMVSTNKEHIYGVHTSMTKLCPQHIRSGKGISCYLLRGLLIGLHLKI
jgi:hypothetical protein